MNLKIETIAENPKHPKSISGSFFIKGVIYITGENKEFEVLNEDFFYTGLEVDGHFLSQSDIMVYLEHELKHHDWNIEIEVDRCYAVLFEFDLYNMQYCSDCGYEYDSEVECKQLHIIPLSNEANDFYLGE